MKIILSGELSVDELGVLYGVISFVTIIAAFNDCGCTESLNYFLPKHLEKQDTKATTQYLLYALTMQMGTSILIGVLLFFGADYLAIHYFESEMAAQVLRIFILFFFGDNLFKTINTFFHAAQDTKLQKGGEFVRMLTLMFAVIAFWMVDAQSLEVYAWSWIIALIVGICVSLTWFITKYRHLVSCSGLRYERSSF